MNVLLSVFIIIIGFNAISIYSEEDTYLDNEDTSDEYSSIDLMTAMRSSATDDEKISPDRDDGIVDIDDIIKSSEFNTMFSPETTQVRRFAAPLKDHTSDDVFKPANLDIQSKAANDKEKSGKEEKKSGKEQVKSDKKENKSDSKEEKNSRKGKNNDKSGEITNRSDENLEKSANPEDEIAPEVAEDKIAAAEIIDQEESRSDELLLETTDTPTETARTSYVRTDKFPDDMDDLIFPYFLDKFRKNYDEETYDRSQYSESQMTLNYEDPAPEEFERDAIIPSRRMLDSPSKPNFNDKAKNKQEMPKKNFIPNHVSSTPKPLTGTAMPNNFNAFMPPNIYQTPTTSPLPYMNNISPYPNLRFPQQPRLNHLQHPPFRRTNSLNQPLLELNNINRFNNWDINSYPYMSAPPFPLSRNVGSNELNPIIRKLIEASNNPRNMPLLDPSKLPMRAGNLYNPIIDPQLRRPQNFNPYLARYMF